jgi:acetylornithine deacetylase/succinyl-diaminopimelate desuccinylase-like protein
MGNGTAGEKVIRRIEKDREFVVELAQNLVRIPSASPNEIPAEAEASIGKSIQVVSSASPRWGTAGPHLCVDESSPPTP